MAKKGWVQIQDEKLHNNPVAKPAPTLLSLTALKEVPRLIIYIETGSKGTTGFNPQGCGRACLFSSLVLPAGIHRSEALQALGDSGTYSRSVPSWEFTYSTAQYLNSSGLTCPKDTGSASLTDLTFEVQPSCSKLLTIASLALNMCGQVFFWNGLAASLTFPKAVLLITVSQQVLCQARYFHHLQHSKRQPWRSAL